MFKNLNYTTCLSENQLVDVLESGRGNVSPKPESPTIKFL